jgi:hypothetical protein
MHFCTSTERDPASSDLKILKTYSTFLSTKSILSFNAACVLGIKENNLAQSNAADENRIIIFL